MRPNFFPKNLVDELSVRAPSRIALFFNIYKTIVGYTVNKQKSCVVFASYHDLTMDNTRLHIF